MRSVPPPSAVIQFRKKTLSIKYILESARNITEWGGFMIGLFEEVV